MLPLELERKQRDDNELNKAVDKFKASRNTFATAIKSDILEPILTTTKEQAHEINTAVQKLLVTIREQDDPGSNRQAYIEDTQRALHAVSITQIN
mgnify:CR=1 FL=1